MYLEFERQGSVSYSKARFQIIRTGMITSGARCNGSKSKMHHIDIANEFLLNMHEPLSTVALSNKNNISQNLSCRIWTPIFFSSFFFFFLFDRHEEPRSYCGAFFLCASITRKLLGLCQTTCRSPQLCTTLSWNPIRLLSHEFRISASAAVEAPTSLSSSCWKDPKQLSLHDKE